MKKSPWLDTLENATLIGVGVGSVISVILKQALYATTPLSLLAVLGFLNRSRYEQVGEDNASALSDVEERFSKQVELLNQQVATLPAPETIQRLKKGLLLKNREVATGLYAEITAVQQEVNQRLVVLEQQSTDSVQDDLHQLNHQYSQLSENLAQFSKELSRLSKSTKIDGLESSLERLKTEIAVMQSNAGTLNHHPNPSLIALQDQVARLDRQLSKLPPPVDASSFKQDVSELIKMIADLVPRRDLVALMNDLKDLHQQQESLKQSIVTIESAAIDFKRTFNALPQTAVAPKSATPPPEWNAVLSGQREAEEPPEQPELGSQKLDREEFDLSAIGLVASGVYPDLQNRAADYLNNLRSQLATVQEVTENLAQQHKQLREQVNHLPQTLDVVVLQRQLKDLSERIPSPEGTFNTFKTRIQDVLQQELQYINERLRSLPNSPNYELVFDLNATQPSSTNEAGMLAGSRAILEEALDCTQNRLILIWPWSNQSSLDDALMEKLERFLRQKRRLDLGWCHLADRNEDRLLGKIKRGWMNESPAQGGAQQKDVLQETLHKLLYLKRGYPDYFQFKILGTSENFLVSDGSFAVLGIADTLKTATPFPDLQLKLRTKDPEVMQRLMHCFDQPTLSPNDLASYWNRAVTRHDLGDRAGAIADYSHILQINPDDDMTCNYRGLAYYDLGDIAAAIADFTRSIQHNPNQKAAYCNRGFIRAEQGDQWGAINDYSLALQAHPDFAVAYLYRGMAWQKLGEHRGALADYSETIHYAPDSAVAHYYRGLAWQKLANYQEAIADLDKAAELFTVRGSQANAQKALKNLVKLRQIAASLPAETREDQQNFSRSPKPTGNGANPFGQTEAIANFFEEVSSENSHQSPESAYSSDALTATSSGTGAIAGFFQESALDTEAEDAPTAIYSKPTDGISP